jgi:hypothetical protein
MLDTQVQILSVDTGDFYSNREATLHWLNHKLRIERNELKKKESDIINKLSEYGIEKDALELILNCEYDFDYCIWILLWIRECDVCINFFINIIICC